MIGHLIAVGTPHVFNFQGIQTLIEGFIGAAVLVVGLALIIRSIGKNWAAVAGSLGVLIIGLLVLGIALVPGEVKSLSGELARLIF
jgi:hypothetical protein